MKKSKALCFEWCVKAQEDEQSIKAVLKDGAPSTACFLSQQMAEKYLKALLILHGQEFPKVHDLLEMETLLCGVDPAIRRLHPMLEHLNRYYIETRYPGNYPTFTKEDGKKAFADAQTVQEFVMARIIKK